MSGTVRGKADRVQSAPDGTAYEQHPNTSSGDSKKRHLHGDTAKHVTLSQPKKAFGKAREILHGAGEPFRQSAEEGEGSERDNQGRHSQARNQQRVQASA